eukprot:COSAG04_NODE_1515_length_6480_cov_5.513086_3_plen_149_part_00
MPEFFQARMLAACVMPISEAATDWAVVYQWYVDGDMAWFKIGLAINLFNGATSSLTLGQTLMDRGMNKLAAAALGLVAGIPGLGPAGWAAFALYKKDVTQGPKILKFLTAYELIFETLPQAMLQCVQASHSRAFVQPARSSVADPGAC